MAVASGIVVHDTTHFLTKYRRVRNPGHSSADAVRAPSPRSPRRGRAFLDDDRYARGRFLVFASSGFEVSWS